MRTFIDFLENIGQDARLRYSEPQQLAPLLARAGIEPAVQSALLSEDVQQLQALLGARQNLCCLIEKPEREDEDEDEDEDEEEEDDEDEESQSRLSIASRERQAA